MGIFAALSQLAVLVKEPLERTLCAAPNGTDWIKFRTFDTIQCRAD